MATRVVRWSAAAQRDLEDIIDYIAGDSELNAESVLDRLQNQALSLNLFAERGRRIPELRSRKKAQCADSRELVVRPWRIACAIENDTVLVLAVVDGRRDFRNWLGGRSADDLSRRIM